MIIIVGKRKMVYDKKFQNLRESQIQKELNASEKMRKALIDALNHGNELGFGNNEYKIYGEEVDELGAEIMSLEAGLAIVRDPISLLKVFVGNEWFKERFN